MIFRLIPSLLLVQSLSACSMIKTPEDKGGHEPHDDTAPTDESNPVLSLSEIAGAWRLESFYFENVSDQKVAVNGVLRSFIKPNGSYINSMEAFR